MLLVVFVLWESYAPESILKEPLVPMYLFRNRPWITLTAVLGVGAGMYYTFALICDSEMSLSY